MNDKSTILTLDFDFDLDDILTAEIESTEDYNYTSVDDLDILYLNSQDEMLNEQFESTGATSYED